MTLSQAEKQAAYRKRHKLAEGEEAYVAKMMKLEPLVGPDGLENARKRQEEYARWRWAGYHAGEIVSL